MRSPGINGEELRGQLANPGSPGKMAVKMECVCVCIAAAAASITTIDFWLSFKQTYFSRAYSRLHRWLSG